MRRLAKLRKFHRAVLSHLHAEREAAIKLVEAQAEDFAVVTDGPDEALSLKDISRISTSSTGCSVRLRAFF